MPWIPFALAAVAVFLLGMSKAGIKGVDMLFVMLLAQVYGSKASTGILLPLLPLADIVAVIYYRRHMQWGYFWRLFPWMLAGILIGVFYGKNLDEATFRKSLAAIILIALALVITLERTHPDKLPANRLFSAAMGTAAGITTMLGNLAGAFVTTYFLSQRITKNQFVSTAAWLFLIVNLIKMPFQIWVWGNITSASLLESAKYIPVLAGGFVLGLWAVGRLNEVLFRKLILGLTCLGSLGMLISLFVQESGR